MMSSSSTSPDFSAEHPVDKLMQRWLRAHDAGDAEAMLELYVEDADYVSIDGQAITGRNAIIGMYSQIFAATKGNQAKISRHRRRIIGGTVVVDDGAWEVNGELPPGAPKDGLYTTVFEQRDGEWKIAAARSCRAQPHSATSGLSGLRFRVGRTILSVGHRDGQDCPSYPKIKPRFFASNCG